MERRPVVRRDSNVTWKSLFKRFLCAYIYKGHKFPKHLGKRSDLVCLRCDTIFYTKTPYKKGKR